MIIEKDRHYSVIQSFTADNTCNENEFTVYDYNQNRAGYIVESLEDNTFEVYHSPNSDFSDYTMIDYADDLDEAIYIITSEIDYDLN